MPKMKTEDDTAIVAYSKKELERLDEYFKGTNAETAYLLGRYCGLRINETFGLKWDHVDFENGTITIQDWFGSHVYKDDAGTSAGWYNIFQAGVVLKK